MAVVWCVERVQLLFSLVVDVPNQSAIWDMIGTWLMMLFYKKSMLSTKLR